MIVNLTDEQLKERDELIANSFKSFMEDIMGYENSDFLNAIDDVISNPRYKKIAIAVGRGHGKSTHLSIG